MYVWGDWLNVTALRMCGVWLRGEMEVTGQLDGCGAAIGRNGCNAAAETCAAFYYNGWEFILFENWGMEGRWTEHSEEDRIGLLPHV